MISNEQLLSIARDVFLELGIRATSAEVAKRAGIAEGTLFRRFDSKEALFRAAMRFDPEDVLSFIDQLPGRAGASDLRATLIAFAEGFIEHARIALPVMMMSWSNPDSHFCSERGGERQQRQQRVLAAVGRFFEAEMKLGRMKRAPTDILARMLLGSLYQFCMGRMFTGGSGPGISPSEFVRGVVDVLLAATVPEPAAGPQRSAGARRRKEVRS